MSCVLAQKWCFASLIGMPDASCCVSVHGYVTSSACYPTLAKAASHFVNPSSTPSTCLNA